ncbi:hypothetical protein [Caballeronia glebae]|uniref:hypothetical protein n=1 Tax=Caballeronia glebae TaxID=1777143 RepID=UPI0038BAC01C
MKSLASLAGLLALTGCASIVSGANQSLSIESRKGTDVVAGATCKLSNDKGDWFVTTPGSVTVHRAYGDLSIKCEKEGIEPGLATVKSTTKGMAFGNILFGGLIGVAVDTGTGAAYDYPPLITVSMGLTTLIAPPAKSAEGASPVASATSAQHVATPAQSPTVAK